MIFQVVEQLRLKTKPEIWRADFNLDENKVWRKTFRIQISLIIFEDF